MMSGMVHGSQMALREYASTLIERWAQSMEVTRAALPQEDWWPRLQADIEAMEPCLLRDQTIIRRAARRVTAHRRCR